MARAKRYYIPGHVWHLTHRCHKKEFLLKFSRDRQRWLEWLFEAKKRYGIRVLNYMVTSNHIHLLVLDAAGRNVIPKTMHLIAGRTGQEFNQRKNRKGAFWEDRYHATAIESDRHLIQCIVYIDLNMVRAEAVRHPSEWKFSGFNEIQKPRRRYRIIDYKSLSDLLNFDDYDELKRSHREWVEALLEEKKNVRDRKWTQSIAVGSKKFIEKVRENLGFRARGRKVNDAGNASFQLREATSIYGDDSANIDIGTENTFLWDMHHKTVKPPFSIPKTYV